MDQSIKRRSKPDAEPTFDEKQGWTCPEGFKFPSCPTCGHRYFGLKPERSVGGASVHGGQCGWCIKELEKL